jgi:hypothetical protein
MNKNTTFTPGKFYMVKTPSGSDIMKLASIDGEKAIVITYNTFGYKQKTPIRLNINTSQLCAK